MPTRSQVEAALMRCALPTKDGGVCGKPGSPVLPAGVCAEHAIAIHRAVKALIDTEVGKQMSAAGL